MEVIPVHGPRAADLLKQAWPGISLPAAPFQRTDGPTGSGIAWIFRWDLLRQPGYHLGVERNRESAIGTALKNQGLAFGLEIGSEETFQTARIEAGIPWAGAEIDETVILNELGSEEMISFTKGCFVGQEIAARIKHRAHPPRLLKGFLLEGLQVPTARSAIRWEGETVGIITSACFSPFLKRVIALGFLKYGLESGSFQVETAAGESPAALAPLPFVPAS